ncbi:hypothetical protein [Geothrix sp. 21YS21S-2]|nr:hypothetical protein [Geothrix sp. 21YS21S-2]
MSAQALGVLLVTALAVLLLARKARRRGCCGEACACGKKQGRRSL